MFVKGNTVYADAFKYLRHKSGRIVALSIKGSADDWEEIEMATPIQVTVDKTMIKWENGLLACIPDTFTYEGVKTKIIKSRYSNDDQIAIMLNKDESEEDAILYQKMQEWREFAAFIAKSINQ